MTIEGAIVDLQNLIDSDGIPFWAKPSLQKVMETVEAERERNIEERKTGKWIDDGQYADYHSEHGFHCSVCGGCIIDYVCQVYDENPHCKWCGAKMEGAEDE